MSFKHFPNSTDGNHCVQACLQTLLDHFSLQVPTLEELDVITDHKPGKYTWMSQALIWLASLDFQIIHVEDLDYVDFAKQGKVYLRKLYSKEVFSVQDQMSDLDLEQDLAVRLIKDRSIQIINSRWNIEEIKTFLGSGYVPLVSVNPLVFDNLPGYAAHLVVVCEFLIGHDSKEKMVRICDPDRGFLEVSADLFQRAMDKQDFSVTFCRRMENI